MSENRDDPTPTGTVTFDQYAAPASSPDQLLAEAVDAYLVALNAPAGPDDDWADAVAQARVKLATAACNWRAALAAPASVVVSPPDQLEQRMLNLIDMWERFNAEEDNDEFGRERYSTREDCLEELRAALARPEPPKEKS